MIIVRPPSQNLQTLQLRGLNGLGAVTNPLDAKVTIPGFGVKISVKDVLLLLCSMGKLNKTLCNVIRVNPAQACTELVNQGDAWLTATLNTVVQNMVGKAMQLVDCKAKNWKDIVKNSFTVTLNEDGISVDFDSEALIQSTICAAVNKSISLSFKPVVNLLVKNLKDGCKKLGASSSPSGSSTTAAPSGSYTAPLSSSSSKVYTPEELFQQAVLAAQEAQKKQQARTVYSVQTLPKSKLDSTVLAWGGAGLAIAGVTYFAMSRRKS